MVAELPVAALRMIASDHDVPRLSLDPIVRSAGSKKLSDNILLDTEGLLVRSPDGKYERAF